MRRFEDVDEVAQFDGIWCCASLLHVPWPRCPSPGAAVERAAPRRHALRQLQARHRRARARRSPLHRCDEATLRHGSADARRPPLDVWLTDDQRPDRTRTLDECAGRTQRPGRAPTARDRRRRPLPAAPVAKPSPGPRKRTWPSPSSRPPACGCCCPICRSHWCELAHDAARVRVLTSDYLDITDPEALRLLMLLQEQGARFGCTTTPEAASI